MLIWETSFGSKVTFNGINHAGRPSTNKVVLYRVLVAAYVYKLCGVGRNRIVLEWMIWQEDCEQSVLRSE